MQQQEREERQERAGDGATVVGDYVVGARLERRAVADVYAATHAPSGAPRLLYVLRPAAMKDHPLTHRVACEADAAHWLRHPAIARLEASGTTPGRRLYVAVERAPGRALADVLADLRAEPAAGGAGLSLRRVVRLASRLAEALDEAHAVGLVHGRLTPAAVFLGAPDERGRELVTLAGLGTAAVVGDAVDEAERPYVSPEQRAGALPDARSDVFGLASLLAHAIEGTPPAVVEAASDAADAATGPAADLWAPTGEAIGAAGVLAAARAANPAARPASVKALWEDLLAALVAEDAASGATTRAAANAVAHAVAHAAANGEESAVARPAASAATTAPGVPPTLDLEALDLGALDLDTLALELLPSLAAADAAEPPASAVPPSGFGGVDVWVPTPRPAAPAPPPVERPAPRAAPRATERVVERTVERTAERGERAPERSRGYVPATWNAPGPVAAPSRSSRRASDGRVWWLAPAVVALAMGWPVVREGRQRAAEARAREEADRSAREAAAHALGVAKWRALDTPWSGGDGRSDGRGHAAGDSVRLPDVPELPVIEIPTFDVAPPGGIVAPPLVRPEEFAPLVRIPGSSEE